MEHKEDPLANVPARGSSRALVRRFGPDPGRSVRPGSRLADQASRSTCDRVLSPWSATTKWLPMNSEKASRLTTDFHCVAGWSATDLRWEGVSFETLYRSVIEPALGHGASVTHVLFRGIDGYASVLLLEDALADDVLIAEHLPSWSVRPFYRTMIGPMKYLSTRGSREASHPPR